MAQYDNLYYIHTLTKEVSFGEVLDITRKIKLTLSIFGTSKNCKIIPQVSLNGINWHSIGGLDISTQTEVINPIVASGLVIDKGLEFDVEGWSYFRCYVDEIADGDISIITNSF